MRLGSRKLSISMLLVLFGSLAAILTACGSGSSSNTPSDLAPSQVYHVLWAGGGSTDVATLDPGEASDSGSIPIVDMLYDGLVVLDKNLNVENWGADKITVSTDGTVYTFHIRPGQEFSDGTPVHASDYAYAMNRSVNPCFASPVNYYLWTIKDASTFSNENCDANGNITAASGQTGSAITTLIGDSIVPDDSAGTLKVTLTAPAGYFLAAMTYSTSYAIEQKVVTGKNLGSDGKWLDTMTQGATGQGSSGIFYLSTWDHQGNIVLKANPHWWGINAGKKPYLTEVDFKVIADSQTLYNTYAADTSNQFDFADSISPPAQVVALQQSKPADFHQAPILETGGIAFNWNIAPFNNLDARQAFCLAINRQQINTALAKGLNTPSWSLLPPGMPGYQDNFPGINGAGTGDNSAAAVQHWNAYKATLNGAPMPKIVFSYNPSSPTATASAQAYMNAWNQTLGTNVTQDPTDWKTILKEEQDKKVQAYRFGWLADYPDPQDFLTLLFSTTSSYNEQNASVPQADQLMQQADAIADSSQQAHRMQLYQQAERLLVDQVAFCPLATYQQFYMQRAYVHGLLNTAQGQPADEQWASAYIAKH